MKHEDSIAMTKQGFEDSFKAGTFYDKQTKDDKHLELILDFVQTEKGMKILDLGTGTGFLAFPLAERNPQAEVVGLDIVEQALDENRKRAIEEGLDNLHFFSYNGMEFPFADRSFDIVVTRYSLHHFPDIKAAFAEINRVLKCGGRLFLSDPAPNDDDTERFVDAYMQMKKDGHIKFYTKTEWQEIGKESGLSYVDGFETGIRFPKRKDTAPEFETILSGFDEKVIKGYGVEVIGDEIWISEKVNNLLFQK